jgi:hypothetical protein
MKKGIFCWLTLIILSIAGVNAQVRIGGTDNPNPSAILDLNVDDTDAGNTKGLALPRVILTSTTGNGGIVNAIKGLLVYNIEGAVPAGTYYFDGSNWNRLSSAAQIAADWTQATTSAVDYIKNKPTLGSLATLSSVATANIANDAVDSTKIRDKGVGYGDLTTAGATNGSVLKYNGTSWRAGKDDAGITEVKGERGVVVTTAGATATVGLPTGTEARQTLIWDGSAWAVGPKMLITNQIVAVPTIEAGDYWDFELTSENAIWAFCKADGRVYVVSWITGQTLRLTNVTKYSQIPANVHVKCLTFF